MNVGFSAVAGRGEGEIDALVVEIPGQRGGLRDEVFEDRFIHHAGLGVVEDDAQTALVFARELAPFQRARLGGSLPGDKTRRIFGRVFTDSGDVRAASASGPAALAG